MKELYNINSYGLFTTDSWYVGGAAWWKFIKDELNIEAPINVMLDSWHDLYMKGNIYTALFSELICVVSKYPKKIHRNINNDLHSVSGQAINWGHSADDTKFDSYYINGRNIPKNYFDKIREDKFTTEDFFKEENEEVKSTCIAMIQELYGENHLFSFFKKDLKEVDSYVDKKNDQYLKGTTGGMNVGVYTLFKGSINGEQVAYVRCYCPSTDRMFYLGVDSKNTTAKDAIASLYRIPKKLKSHIKSISRQGERFATILSDEGKNILNGLSQNDISNTEPISGDQYFKLMTYEY